MKSREMSVNARRDGNAAYERGEYAIAGQHYTRSLAHAPMESGEYALALANRSAATAKLERCVRACTRAHTHHAQMERLPDRLPLGARLTTPARFDTHKSATETRRRRHASQIRKNETTVFGR